MDEKPYSGELINDLIDAVAKVCEKSGAELRREQGISDFAHAEHLYGTENIEG